MLILVAFASKHGSTQEISERITTRLRQMGKDVAIQSVQSVEDVRQYEAFVIGSAVYFGSWMKEATDFTRRNRDALAARPVWLFSSGPTGEASLPEPKEISELKTAVRPREHREFAGRRSTPLAREALAGIDAALICTDHDSVDYAALVEICPLVIDTRNVCARTGLARENIIKA